MKNKKVILIVDDEPDIVRVLSSNINMQYDEKKLLLLRAYDVEEAITKIKTQSIDMLITDFSISAEKTAADIMLFLKNNFHKPPITIIYSGSDKTEIIKTIEEVGYPSRVELTEKPSLDEFNVALKDCMQSQ